MSTLAILCSGQGGQGPGMFALTEGEAAAEPVFRAAAALLGADPRALVASAEPGALHANRTAQILCCTAALAAWACLGPRAAPRRVVAGYSVGEVPAWSVAGAMTFDAALAVTAERADLMDAATPGPSAMAAVRGLSPANLERVRGEAGVHVAIRNGPDQAVLAGSRDAMARALAAAEAAGAAKVTAIPVAVPSHTPLLKAAAEAFAGRLRVREDVRRPAARLLSGIDGAAVFDPRAGLQKLARAVAETVDWAACLEACRAAGATRAFELGPGASLARMMGGLLPERDCRSLADFRTLEGAAAWLREAED